MPTAERYSRYREDQTTIWVSKTAADTLSRERNSPGALRSRLRVSAAVLLTQIVVWSSRYRE